MIIFKVYKNTNDTFKACLFLCDAVHHFEKKSVIILQMVKPDRPINQWLHYNLSIDTLVNELNFLFFF